MFTLWLHHLSFVSSWQITTLMAKVLIDPFFSELRLVRSRDEPSAMHWSPPPFHSFCGNMADMANDQLWLITHDHFLTNMAIPQCVETPSRNHVGWFVVVSSVNKTP